MFGMFVRGYGSCGKTEDKKQNKKQDTPRSLSPQETPSSEYGCFSSIFSNCYLSAFSFMSSREKQNDIAEELYLEQKEQKMQQSYKEYLAQLSQKQGPQQKDTERKRRWSMP